MLHSQNDDHPKTAFGKFGYILDMKFSKKHKPLIFLPTFSFCKVQWMKSILKNTICLDIWVMWYKTKKVT
jgi:hypothetical protein